MKLSDRFALAMCVIALGAASAQPPAPPAGRGPGRGAPPPPAGGNPFANAFPQHEAGDPAAIERGKALYGVQCNFCHGSDARGGEGGPNLLRSDLVLNDKDGELIAQVVQNGRGEMPKINLTAPQIADVAAYIHSFRVAGYDASRNVPPSILVGNATEGEAYFKSTCASCHSVTGDLKGIGSRFADPKQLQNYFLLPGGGRGGRGPSNLKPVTVTVTPASGKKIEGRLLRIDDFIVTLVDSEGAQRTIRRDGDVPKVEVHDPMEAHRQLLPKYTDKDIHNLTSYLVTVK
ncbi:MAG TPA: c-type cytochrome [Bryobacteraceae bacterium]|nr:c-type cytochrome [Bryobacteraceae bacterium]